MGLHVGPMSFAQRQGKYWELHKAMLGAKGQMNEAAAL